MAYACNLSTCQCLSLRLLLLVFIPPPLARRSRSALEGIVGGPQGRHDAVAPHVLRARRDGAQLSEAGPHQGRIAQQHVLGSVSFLPADRAGGCGAALVPAPVTCSGGACPTLSLHWVLGRVCRVAGPQLVDVKCRRSISTSNRAGGVSGNVNTSF